MAMVTVELDADQVGWLHTLVGAYRDLREAADRVAADADLGEAPDFGPLEDEDPVATMEMLFAAEKLYATLFAALWATRPELPPVPDEPRVDDPTVPY